MNTFMIKRLVLKDWHFQRWPIAACLAAGILGVALLGAGSQGSFYAGTVILITVVILIGIRLAISTIVNERKDQTLPFIMSLPISPRDYTLAKIIANLTIYLIPWTALTVATCFAVQRVNPGVVPVAILTLVEHFTVYCLLLMTAIVSESEAWTVSVMVAGNLFLQAYLYLVGRIPGIEHSLKTKVAIWDQGSVTLLVVEIVLALMFLATTLLLQSRKRDFL
jgi:ABC-type Na+ efflux pump permease subunit